MNVEPAVVQVTSGPVEIRITERAPGNLILEVTTEEGVLDEVTDRVAPTAVRITLKTVVTMDRDR